MQFYIVQTINKLINKWLVPTQNVGCGCLLNSKGCKEAANLQLFLVQVFPYSYDFNDNFTFVVETDF